MVSILTTTYNHERFISTCIESVIGQTYQNWEMIIIDDGSTDKTPEVIARYQDPRVRYFRHPNKGIGRLHEMYSWALQKAKGELVTILAGDDAWPAYRLEKQVPLFQEAGVVVCFGRGVIINESGKEIAQVPRGKVPPVLNRPVGSILADLLVENYLPSYTYLIDRGALERIGGFVQPPGVLGVDSPTLLKIALEGEFRYVDLPMGFWRVHHHQHTNNFRLEQALSDNSYALSFFRSLSPEIQAVTGWNEARLAATLQKRLNNAYFEAGRRHLLSGNRRQAARHFMIALWRGTPLTKAKAATGIVCGFMGTDVEWVARLTGRTALR